MKCLYCNDEAAYGEYLVFDWWTRNKLDIYLIAACVHHKIHAQSEVRRFFYIARWRRNPLAFGSILQAKSSNEVEIWSNMMLTESWRLAGRLRIELLEMPDSKIKKANKYDWRGAAPSSSRQYQIHSLRAAEESFKILLELIRLKKKDPKWEPLVKETYPKVPDR